MAFSSFRKRERDGHCLATRDTVLPSSAGMMNDRRSQPPRSIPCCSDVAEKGFTMAFDSPDHGVGFFPTSLLAGGGHIWGLFSPGQGLILTYSVVVVRCVTFSNKTAPFPNAIPKAHCPDNIWRASIQKRMDGCGRRRRQKSLRRGSQTGHDGVTKGKGVLSRAREHYACKCKGGGGG